MQTKGLDYINQVGNEQLLKLDGSGDYQIGFGNDSYYDITYSPSGNDLVITAKIDTYRQGEISKFRIKDAALTEDEILLNYIDENWEIYKSEEIRRKNYAPTYKKGTYTGTNFNEETESTKANETFNLGGGNDVIRFKVTKEERNGRTVVTGIGKDTVKLSDGENISLYLKGVNNDDISSIYKDGNDLVIYLEDVDVDTLKHTYYGQIRLQDFHKLGTGSITLFVDDDSESANKYLYEEMNRVYEVKGKKNMYTGSNFNEEATSKKANETFALGSGADTVHFEDVFGKDNVTLKSDEVMTLDFSQLISPEYTVSRSGNNAIIKVTAGDGNGYSKNFGQVTLTNYFKLNDRDMVIISDEDDDYRLSDLLQNTLVYDYSSAKKKQTINATFLNEEITGSNYADKINTYAGEDAVTAGRGNDTITLGSGVKTIYINGGDGNDVIKGLSNVESLTINIDDTAGENKYIKTGNNLIIEHGIYSYKQGKTTIYTTDEIREVDNTKAKGVFYTDGEKIITKSAYSKLKASVKADYSLVDGDVFYYKSGSKTIYTFDEIREVANKFVTEKTTIYDYFKDDNASKVTGIDEIENLYIQGYDNVRWAEDGGYMYPLFGTDYNDIITGSSKNDIIISGLGVDKITPGKGMDYIALACGKYDKSGWTLNENSDGDVIINFKKGDGKDIVAYDPVYIRSLDMNFDENGTISYYKQGDAFVIENHFAKTAKSKAVTDTVSMPGFFMHFNDKSYIDEFYDGIDTVLQKTQINGEALDFDDGLVVKPIYDSEHKVTSNVHNTKNKVYLYEGSYFTNDIMTYTGKDCGAMFGDVGDDVYNIGKMTAKTDVFISDTNAEDSNILNINSKAGDLVFMFDVDDEGNFVIDKNDDETQSIWGLQIYRKSDLTTGKNISKNFRNGKFGSVTIDHYFSEEASSVVASTNMTLKTADGENGALTEFSCVIGDTQYNLNDYLAQVAQAVSGWLSDNGYETSYQAFTDTKTDITSLIKVYATGSYTPKS